MARTVVSSQDFLLTRIRMQKPSFSLGLVRMKSMKKQAVGRREGREELHIYCGHCDMALYTSMAMHDSYMYNRSPFVFGRL